MRWRSPFVCLALLLVVACDSPEDGTLTGPRAAASDPAPTSPTPGPGPGTDAGVSSPGSDAGTPPPDGATTDAGTDAATGKVPIFVAQGDMGRTTISCDDGKTWVANRAYDTDGDPTLCGGKQSVMCGGTCSYNVNGTCQSNTCCGDTADRARGIAYGGGQFVGTWGWGMQGAVRRSTNGVDWTTTRPSIGPDGSGNFGGVAFGAGRFVLASRAPMTSADGTSWTAGGAADFANNNTSVRTFAYADYKGGSRFLAIASGYGQDILVSSDVGQTWWRPASFPAECGNSVMVYGGFVAGNDIIVVMGMDGVACRSVDGGQTWTSSQSGVTGAWSHGVWTGTEFWYWGNTNGDWFRLSSADGATWTKTPTAPGTWVEGPVARGPTGTLVAIANLWDGYEKQQFLRSTDGLTWESLPTSAFAGSHQIFNLVAGYADPSTVCQAH